MGSPAWFFSFSSSNIFTSNPTGFSPLPQFKNGEKKSGETFGKVREHPKFTWFEKLYYDFKLGIPTNNSRNDLSFDLRSMLLWLEKHNSATQWDNCWIRCHFLTQALYATCMFYEFMKHSAAKSASPQNYLYISITCWAANLKIFIDQKPSQKDTSTYIMYHCIIVNLHPFFVVFLHLRETPEKKKKKKTCVVLLPYGPSCFSSCSEFLHQSFDFLRVFFHLAEGCFCFSRRAFSQQFFHPKAPHIWMKTHIICYPIEGTGEERLLWLFRHRSKISNDIKKSGNIWMFP